MLPPLPAVHSVAIEIFGPTPGSAKWDETAWDTATWTEFTWSDITPESMHAQISWGADDIAGVLTTPAAGSWQLNTYDPERKLDPANGASPFAASLKPGRPIRIVYTPEGLPREVVRQGLIDEVEFDIIEKTGSIRGTDMVSVMVGNVIPAGQTGLPVTLRAISRALIERAGISHLVKVEDTPPDPSEPRVINGDMEMGTTYGWSGHEMLVYDGGLSSEGWGHNGKYIGELRPQPGGWAETWQRVDVIENRQYIHSCMVGNVNGYLYTEWHDSNDAVVEPAGILYFERNGGWGPGGAHMPVASHTVTAPPGAVQARVLVVNADTTNPLVFDDMKFHLASPVDMDPVVGHPVAEEATLWSHLGTYAKNALHAIWLDRFGVLRFRSFGDPRNNGLQAGGDGGIPLSSLISKASLNGVYTHIHCFDWAAPDNPVWADDLAAQAVYGIIEYKRDVPVPYAQQWASAVLADRAGASLQYAPGTLYPQTHEHMMALLDVGMIDILNIVIEKETPPASIAARVLGGFIRADTETGWTATLTSYIPAKEWQDAEVPLPPEQPIEPPPDQTTTAQRVYDAVKDTRAAKSSGGANYGSGTEGELPVGAWQGWRNRAFIGFAAIPFGDVVSVNKATLEVDTTDQVNVGFGSSPKVKVQRVTQSWNEGTLSSPGSANATVYPGPSMTSTGSVTKSLTKSENAAQSIDVTEIVRAWFGGQPQHGVGIVSAGEDSTTYTTEFWSRENATASRRPRLVLDLTVKV